jgi:hypothetical protein
MADPRPVHPALMYAVRRGLPDHDMTADYGVPEISISGEDGGEVLARARFDRTIGFLASALIDGTLEASDDTVQTAASDWHRSLLGVVLVEAFAVRTAAALDDAGVRWRLTKGAALAHLDYREQLAERTFGDVDLMIHPDDWAAALDALYGAGLRRHAPELRPGYDRRFGKGATLIDERAWEIDLHLRFAIGRFGLRARMEELFERGDEIELAGRVIPVLAGPDRLLHACHHLVLGGFSALRVARDVAQLVLVSEVDWEASVTTAERWRVDAVVASGIVQAWERLELEIDHPAHRWAVGHPITGGDARAIAIFTAERSFRSQALTAVPALAWHRVPGYLWALGVPSRTSRRERGRTLVGQFRRAVRR